MTPRARRAIDGALRAIEVSAAIVSAEEGMKRGKNAARDRADAKHARV
jgi:hypothetical protein